MRPCAVANSTASTPPSRCFDAMTSPCQSYSPQAHNRGPGVLLRRSHQCVAGQGNVKHFARGRGPSDGKAVGIEQTELNEHTGLVPVDVLMHEFVFLELHNRHCRNLHCASGGLNAWQHPVHPSGVCETDDELVDKGTLPDGGVAGGGEE